MEKGRIPTHVMNDAAARANGKCECDNPACRDYHALGECSWRADNFEAGAAVVGSAPTSEEEMKRRVKWMCETCRKLAES